MTIIIGNQEFLVYGWTRTD